MFREIRGIEQRRVGELRRWFQDEWFDLFFVAGDGGRLRWFQLCYARDTWRERVLEWRRGRGFQHLRVKQPRHAGDREAGVLTTDGRLPYDDVAARFRDAAGGLPADIAGFIAEKIRQYAHPDRHYRRKGAITPAWLVRLRAKL